MRSNSLSVSRSVGLRPRARPTRWRVILRAENLERSHGRRFRLIEAYRSAAAVSPKRTRLGAPPRVPWAGAEVIIGQPQALQTDERVERRERRTSACSRRRRAFAPPRQWYPGLRDPRGRPGMNTSWLSRAHPRRRTPAKRDSGSRMSLFRHTSEVATAVVQSPPPSGRRTSTDAAETRATSGSQPLRERG